MFFTEEEIFAQDLVPFWGEVVSAANLRLTVGGSVMYRAVIDVQVSESLPGGPKSGETVRVLLPNPLMEGVWVEDSDVTSALARGRRRSFWPRGTGKSRAMRRAGNRFA